MVKFIEFGIEDLCLDKWNEKSEKLGFLTQSPFSNFLLKNFIYLLF